MNYRHAFHAGNFADLVKHAALLRLIADLTSQSERLTVIDTHAGRGLYDLAGPEAQRSGEAAAGVLRLMDARQPPAEFAPLIAAVRGLNGAGPVSRYPGSPWLAAQALRPQDRLIACELRPADQAALRKAIKDDPRVEALCADGFETALARCPASGPALVLIDPPFERADDYAQVVRTVAAVRRRNSQARVLVWLPLKDLETLDAFLRDLEDEDPGPLLVAETRMRPLTDPMRMNGCALVLIGESGGAEQVLETVCHWTAQNLGESGSARVYAL